MFLLLLVCLSGFSQFTPYGLGLVQQPNSASARFYLGITTGGGTNSGTLTNFSSGNLSPLFTTSVATPTTFPKLTFAQISENQNLVFASPNGAAGVPTFRALASGDIPTLTLSKISDAGTAAYSNATAFVTTPTNSGTASDGDLVSKTGGQYKLVTITPGSGTVTSFSSGTLSPLFTTSVATPSTTPALSFALNSQSANTIFAGPASGVPATPTFRTAVPADLGAFTNHSDVVPSTLNPGDVMSWSGSAWTNGPPSTNGTIIGTSLPGLLTRPVIASSSGTLSAPTWPDDNTYYFDDDFDVWLGSSSGQFGRMKWTVTANGGGGGVNNVSSNNPPYYGLIELQSPTTVNNTFVVSQYGATALLPYYGLGTSSNWLFHCVFFLNVTNQGSIYRIGLGDFGFNSAATSMNPSNCIVLRWDKNKNDPNNFVFEARSNATINTQNSTIRPAANSAFKLTMFSTNAGTALCSVNGEAWVTVTNLPVNALCISFMDATTNGIAQRLWIDRASFMQSSLGR